MEPLLRLQWSPEQISGDLRRHRLLTISHETIYRHVWRDRRQGGTLYQHLRGAHKQRRRRYGAYDSRGRLAGKRLCKRFRRLTARGNHPNVVVTGIARELLAFMWAIAKEVPLSV